MNSAHSLLPTVVAVLFALPVTAQDKPDRDPRPAGGDVELQLEADGKAVDEALAGKMEAAGPVEPHYLSGLGSYLAPVVGVKPWRIPPGGSGEIHLILAMQRSAVLVPGEEFQVSYQPEQGPLRLGAWRLADAEPGTIEPAFKGQPVYENTVQVVIPVSITGDAEMTRHNVHFGLQLQLTDGQSGKPIGKFQGPAQGQVNVGPALPTPRVRTGVAVEAGSGTTGTAPATGDPNPVDAVDANGDPTSLSGTRIDPVAEGDEIRTGPGYDGQPLPIASGEGWTSIWLIGGGVGVLAIFGLLFLAGRRR